MKICYHAWYNTINEIGYKLLVNHRNYIIFHLRKILSTISFSLSLSLSISLSLSLYIYIYISISLSNSRPRPHPLAILSISILRFPCIILLQVVDLCEAFLLGAKWFNEKIIPNVEEYLKNNVTSTGTHVASLHVFFLLGSPISKVSLRLVCSRKGLLIIAKGSSKRTRERGRGFEHVVLHARKRSCGEDGDAQKYIRGLISTVWKDLNGEAMAPLPLPLSIINCFYQHSDDPKAPRVDDIVKAFIFRSSNRR
ncbi:unnamed protein product [Spirodela intermedia]|uniref:Terpene synthase metal-binding domain-containing protein n=1 Tax=Spirodela intermedia TaxID=51605 RepID=A0A7I8K1C7_SPIIN|nr:unnamed protein product [Spirodela intermedia]